MIKLNISKQRFSFFSYAQLFLSLSIMFGTWVIYIPHITEKLNMTDGQLGIALFFSAVGSLIGAPVGKSLTNKYGEGRVSFYSLIVLSFFMVALFLAPTFYIISAVMLFLGISIGIFQVGINSLVATVERTQKISIMSACHGFFSLGAIVSAGFGTILLIAVDNPLIHILLAAGVVIILQIIFIRSYFFVKNPISESTIPADIKPLGDKVRKHGIIFWLAIIALSVMVAEGGIADWSGLYLRDVALAEDELLGLGYAGFSLTMTIGRFIGDYFSKRFGAMKIISVGFLIGLIGFSIVLLGEPLLSIMGFVVVGAGFSIIVPEIYRLAANVDGVDSASGIAFMASAGSVGFLAGPVVLGLIADAFGLSVSFITLAVLVAIGGVMALILQMNKGILTRNLTYSNPLPLITEDEIKN